MSTEEDQPDRDEVAFMRGNRVAWTRMLRLCLMGLGYEDTEGARAKWIVERDAAVAALRKICGEFGDNDWKEDLSLSDVIEKHLGQHLENEE